MEIEPSSSGAAVKAEMSDYYDRLASNSSVAKGMEVDEDLDAIMAREAGRRYFQMRKMQMAERLGGFRPGQRLVEVGCATGPYTVRLAREMGYRMTGVDLSPKSITVALDLLDSIGLTGEIDYREGDFEKLDCVGDDEFEGLVSFSCIRYVPDPLEGLKQALRVVKPGGRVVVDFPNRFCPWFKVLKTKFGVNVHFGDRHFSAREVEAMFCEAGFEDVCYRKLLFTPTITPRRILPAFRAIDLIAERLPGLKETAAIIMCTGRVPAT